jgi:hypothetical protein
MYVPTLSFPCTSSTCPIWPSTRIQIRINRLLAWGLVVSPVVQIATDVSFWRGLWFDVVVVLVHGALSLKLFGAPKTAKSGAARDALLVTGISPVAVSPRNKLLLSGYRIFLAMFYSLSLLAIGLYTPLLPWLGPVLALLGFYTMARFPFSSVGHLYVASQYAAKRWGARSTAQTFALIIVMLFAIVSYANLLRA